MGTLRYRLICPDSRETEETSRLKYFLGLLRLRRVWLERLILSPNMNLDDPNTTEVGAGVYWRMVLLLKLMSDLEKVFPIYWAKLAMIVMKTMIEMTPPVRDLKLASG